ncbi:hypothetical protein C0995_000266 [Termitomyces sp. Mi166|nr:hypothetical protein C0995_000266 [Termitomyces sp. Mi166\
MPFNSPLQYPAGTPIVQGMPIHKRDIFNLLGLPALPGEPTVAQRRAQIGDFLGTM